MKWHPEIIIHVKQWSINLMGYDNITLDDTFDFKESLEIVDLSKGHRNEEKRLKYRPPDHSRVGIVIDCVCVEERERERESTAFKGLNKQH